MWHIAYMLWEQSLTFFVLFIMKVMDNYPNTAHRVLKNTTENDWREKIVTFDCSFDLHRLFLDCRWHTGPLCNCIPGGLDRARSIFCRSCSGRPPCTIHRYTAGRPLVATMDSQRLSQERKVDHHPVDWKLALPSLSQQLSPGASLKMVMERDGDVAH